MMIFTPSFAVASFVFSSSHAAPAPIEPSAPYTCPPWHSPEAHYWNGLLGLGHGKMSSKEDAQAQIKEMNWNPKYSSCMGSISFSLKDALEIVAAPECKESLKFIFPKFMPPFGINFEMDPDFEAFSSQLQSLYAEHSDMHNIIGNLEAWQKFFYTLEPLMFEKVTTLFRGGLKRCLVNQVVPKIFSLMLDAPSDCCGDVKKFFKDATALELNEVEFMAPFDKLIDFLFTTLPNGQSCLHRFVQTYFGTSLEKDMKQCFSMPSDEGCSAANGQPFMTLIEGATEPYTFHQSIGCCAVTYDAMITKIKTFPMVLSYVPAEAFAPEHNDCVVALELPIVQKSLAFITNPELKGRADEFANGLCVHLANGYAQDCDFVDPETATCSPVV